MEILRQIKTCKYTFRDSTCRAQFFSHSDNYMGLKLVMLSNVASNEIGKIGQLKSPENFEPLSVAFFHSSGSIILQCLTRYLKMGQIHLCKQICSKIHEPHRHLLCCCRLSGSRKMVSTTTADEVQTACRCFGCSRRSSSFVFQCRIVASCGNGCI